MMKKVSVFQLLLLIGVVGFGVFMVPGFIVEPAYANPVTNTDVWYSRPQGYSYTGFTVGTNLIQPARAYDTPIAGNGNDTYAEVNYVRGVDAMTWTLGDATGSTKSFKIPTVRTLAGLPNPSIVQVDVVMTWGTNESTKRDAGYSFQLALAAGAFTTFYGPSKAAQTKITQTWANQPKPGGGSWTWVDISKVQIRVLTAISYAADAWMSFYDIKLNVVVKSAPRLFVSPANVTDTTKLVGSTFTVYVELENVSMSAGTEFKFRYDPRILDITATVPTAPAAPAEDQPLPADFIYSVGTMWTYSVDESHGIVHISYTSGPLASPPAPTFGSGKVVQLNFAVIGLGLTTLKLYENVQGKPGGAPIACDLTNGYFRNVAMPYGASMKATAPAGTQILPFTVEINITKTLTSQSGAFCVYSWEFNMTYDENLIEATAVWEGTYFGGIGPTTFSKSIGVNLGWVWARSTLLGDYPGQWGNGTIATIDFDIVGTGTSPLTFVANEAHITRIDYGLGPPSPTYDLPVTTVDGTVEVQLGLPEFPLGGAIEIALIPVIVLIAWKARRRKPVNATKSPQPKI